VIRINLGAVVICLLFFVLNGCSSLIYESKVPVQTVLMTIPSEQPDWVKSEKRTWVDNGVHYSIGYSEDSIDLQSSINTAESDGKIKLSMQVESSLIDRFNKYMGVPEYGVKTKEYVNKYFNELIKGLNIPLQRGETYGEKIKERFEGKKRVYYRSYIILSLLKNDGDKLLQQVLVDLKEKVKANQSALKLVKSIEQKYLLSISSPKK